MKLNISQTQEEVLDYQRNRRLPAPVIIQGRRRGWTHTSSLGSTSRINWTGLTTLMSSTGRDRAVGPEETQIIEGLYQAEDPLPVCGGPRTLLCCGVLVRSAG